MAKKKTPQPRALSSFDDLDAAGIGAGYVSPFTPGAAPAADEAGNHFRGRAGIEVFRRTDLFPRAAD